MKRFLGLLVALAAMSPSALSQIMGGPEPPDVAWAQELGSPLPLETRFVDHTGAEVSLGECLGERPVVLAFVYYECPMLCGLVLEGMIKALRGVELATSVDFDVLVVSIDPTETSALAAAKRRSALADYGLDAERTPPGSWRFLVGPEPAIQAVTRAAGFRYSYIPERDEWAHAAGITILTPEGVVSRVLFGVEFAPRDVRLALVEASDGTIGTPLDQVLLRCFHYDPTRGKYGLAILTIVRALGSLTVAILAFLVVRWIVHERRARPAMGRG